VGSRFPHCRHRNWHRAWSTFRQLRQWISEQESEVYKFRIGRLLLLGVEVPVTADIVKTIGHVVRLRGR
jgi:hypothetical protein